MPGIQNQDGHGSTDSDDDDDQTGTGTGGTESDSNDDNDGDTGDSDESNLTPEQLAAENKRLKDENAKRRIENKKLKDDRKKADDDAKKALSDAQRVGVLEASDKEKDQRIASLTIGNALRDYLADKHPDYLKLSNRISRFVDLDGVDLDDEDAIQEKVEEAVEAFVKDVPITAGQTTDSNGVPVGGVGRVPAGGSGPNDKTSKDRLAELFPGIYKSPRSG